MTLTVPTLTVPPLLRWLLLLLLLLLSFFVLARSEMRLLLVKLNPTKGRCSPEKAGSCLGGCVSHGRRSLSSTSKLDVSVGELT